jgi:uncharacterized membrane protein YfcA
MINILELTRVIVTVALVAAFFWRRRRYGRLHLAGAYFLCAMAVAMAAVRTMEYAPIEAGLNLFSSLLWCRLAEAWKRTISNRRSDE